MQNYKGFAFAFLILAVIGFSDATFLTVEGFLGATAPCSIKGCEQVLTSQYATIGGVPTALLGSLYYAVIFLLALLSISRAEKKYLLMAAGLTIVGLLASLVFVYLQLFIIRAICVYCILSAAISLALFALGILVLVKKIKRV